MPKKETTSRLCELCSEPAKLYCSSDSAFLCRICDSSVHSANFLVARHLRSSLCSSCLHFDGHHFSGAQIPRFSSSSCKSCGLNSNDETESENDDVSSLSSSACISSTESSTAGPNCCGEVSSAMRRCKVGVRAEGVLVNWCKRLGGNNYQNDVVVETAMRVSSGVGLVPIRVALATSFWVGLRFSGDTCRDLKRVEKITGVPAKMILALEAKMERVMKTRRKIASQEDDSKEGWAEC